MSEFYITYIMCCVIYGLCLMTNCIYVVGRDDNNKERLMTDYCSNDIFDRHISFRGRLVLLGK